ncbi:MAG: glycerol-3-phosphate 1-O-acyltransferase PlsY [Dethiobacter sp.]|nr:glycerol-3-phosphate 1-O-acyltransferase PlsY [Dethiobacter sp.]MCL5981683.1 glycerol-3-phosphate 1-O-acyltransferase PlsY [Bacillota bacterium]
MNSFLAVLLAYLLGSVSFGYLVGRRIRGVDIRQYGSGSSGTTNILRTLGTGPAVVVLLLDAGKGIGAVYLADLLTGNPNVVMLAGVAVVAGHNWPVFFGFRGGRGIATSMGVLLGIAPSVILIAVLVGLLVMALTRYVSLGSLVGSVLIPFLMLLFRLPPAHILFGTALCLLAVWRHRANIRRLLAGTESKLGKKVAMGEKRVRK